MGSSFALLPFGQCSTQAGACLDTLAVDHGQLDAVNSDMRTHCR